MNALMEVIARAAAIGIGATVVMDLWLLLLNALNIPTLNCAVLGRWIGNMFRGQWMHDGIAKAKPVRGELALGWVVHYASGITFALLLTGLVGYEWLRAPTLLPALLLGVSTVLLPLFVMQPAMGAGIASSRTKTPMRNCLRSLGNHTVFGLGLYVAALTFSPSIRA